VRVSDGGGLLVIEDSAVSDSGIYRCTASNGVDHDTSVVSVTIKGMTLFEIQSKIYRRKVKNAMENDVSAHDVGSSRYIDMGPGLKNLRYH